MENHLGFVFINKAMARIIHETYCCFSPFVVLFGFLLKLFDSILDLVPWRIYELVDFFELQIAFSEELLHERSIVFWLFKRVICRVFWIVWIANDQGEVVFGVLEAFWLLHFFFIVLEKVHLNYRIFLLGCYLRYEVEFWVKDWRLNTGMTQPFDDLHLLFFYHKQKVKFRVKHTR